MSTPRSILFVCTGNYYRSRFSEHFFNHLAPRYQLSTRADSAGLRHQNPDNTGPISRYARKRLNALEIPVDEERFPRGITEYDLRSFNQVIALDEDEHRPMMDELWPEWADHITYWQIPDIQFMEPEEALDRLVLRLRAYLECLRTS